MNPQITVPPSPTNIWQLAPADYQALIAQRVLILSSNPDGTQIQITLTATVYQPQAQIEALNAQITADQAEVAQATAAEQTNQQSNQITS